MRVLFLCLLTLLAIEGKAQYTNIFGKYDYKDSLRFSNYGRLSKKFDYLNNIGASFTNRSLIDKGYADSAIAANIGMVPVYTASNGLTKVVNDFRLGGTLNAATAVNAQTNELILKADDGATSTYLSFLPNTGTLNTVNGNDYADVSTNKAGSTPYIIIGAGNLFDGDHGTLYIDQDVLRLSRTDGLFHFKNNSINRRGQLGFNIITADRDYTFPDASGTIALTTDIPNSWNLTGNSGTTDGVNFIGTTDGVPLNFQVNNFRSGRIDHVNANAFFGYRAGQSTSSSGNIAVGHLSLFNTTTGGGNVAVGSNAMQDNIGGQNNTAVGYQSLQSNTSANYNTAIGSHVLFSNTTGIGNTGVGYEALQSNTTGGQNSALGYGALSGNADGENNVALGYQSMIGNTSGDENIAIGVAALNTNTTGTGNISIGANSNVLTNNLTNATAIGYRSAVNQSNSLVLGSINGVNFSTNDTKVGIGTTTPSEKLHIANGTIRIQDGNEGAGKILQSDANGVGSWVDAPATITASNGLTKDGNDIQLGGTIIKNTTITGDYTKYLIIDGINSLGITTQSGISLNGGVENYLYGPFWEVDGLLRAFTDFEVNDSSKFHGYGLLDSKFNYATNIGISFTDRSLVDKGYVDSSINNELASYPKNLITNFTDVGNVGTGEDNLMTYSIPAGKLANDGDYLEFTMTLIFAANVNAKEVKLYYGATNFYASTAQIQNGGSMEIKGTIIRTGATSQRITFSQVNNTTLFPDYADYTTASETLANAITLKATGEATSNNDIVQKILLVKYFPGN